ncbi:hypothetical protein [Kitasatospora sp. MAP5-34]|uniref:hypothetical protein n=1 Tax=Kitasatospora sp. MAP5-34 TaxID=3035102 RepID=UPI002473026A|nr:hypothetical protein [Kitasatospora sp. MAP5-34]MDH6577558.1 hypothetical protein [Kitasatospora sp. MAP5-34]
MTNDQLPADTGAEQPAKFRKLKGLWRPVFGKREPDGASWGKVHNAVGVEDFALDPAPGVAGQDRRQGAPDQEVETEGGLDQEELPDTAATDDAPAVRLSPTVDPAEFVHCGVAALNILELPTDSTTAASRPLSEILYRPRSGIKRTINLTASAEEPERDFIDAAARAFKRSRSAYLMDCALTIAHAFIATGRPDAIAPLPSPQATSELLQLTGRFLREMNRVGVNLNQIAFAVNKGDLPDRAEEVLDEVHASARSARLAFEHVIKGCRHGA